MLEFQLLLQLAQQVGGALFGVQLLGLLCFVELILPHIGQREVEQVTFVASLRHGDCDAFQLHLDGERHDDFARTALVSLPHLHDAQCQHVGRFFVHALCIFEGEGLVDTSVGHVQVVDECRMFVVGYREHVDVVVVSGYHLALFAEFECQVILAFQFLCFLKSHLGGQLLHLLHEFGTYSARVSFEYLAHFGHTLHVVVAALQAHAWCLAVFYVVFQARLVFTSLDSLGRDRLPASPERIDAVDEFEHVVECAGVAEGSVVCSCTGYYLAGLEHSREVFVGDTHRRVGLVVLQQYVVAWLVAFYEVVFEQERIFVAGHNDVVYVAYLAHQYLCLPRCLRLEEVGAHASFQVLCLTYIDYGAALVEVLVASRTFGQGRNNGLEVCEAVGRHDSLLCSGQPNCPALTLGYTDIQVILTLGLY